MNGDELDVLDQTIARIVGSPAIGISSSGQAIYYQDRSPYRPTRNPDETVHLIDRYIAKVVRMNDGTWAAVGPSGRACVGHTLAIAVFRAVVEAR